MGVPAAAGPPLLIKLDALFARPIAITALPTPTTTLLITSLILLSYLFLQLLCMVLLLLILSLPNLILGGFSLDQVSAFELQPLSGESKEPCVFFLSHRGPDTKLEFVRPLAHILGQLGVKCFFDRDDSSLKLGHNNYAQMSEAAWSCSVGAVVISDTYDSSRWCLMELNTFLERRRRESDTFRLLLIYYSGAMLNKPLYKDVLGSISSVVRPSEEAAYEFVVNIVPRMLEVDSIRDLPSVRRARDQLAGSPLAVKRLWNEYAKANISEQEHKRFPEAEEPQALTIIQNMHNSLIPSDIHDKLRSYEPLLYSLIPILGDSDRLRSQDRNDLEDVVKVLLDLREAGLSPRGVASVIPTEDHPLKDHKQLLEEIKESNSTHARPPIIRTGSTGVSQERSSLILARIFFVEGVAGSGKSLFGWHIYRQYQPTKGPIAIPLYLSLPEYRTELRSSPDDVLVKFFARTFSVSVEQVRSLYSLPFVFLLDGLDELGFKPELYRVYRLHTWINSKFVIMCRSGFLSDEDTSRLLVPRSVLNSSIDEPGLFKKIFLLPFTNEQRLRFIRKFSVRYASLYHWDSNEYVQALAQLPELRVLAREPLLLFMVLHVLPGLTAPAASGSTNPNSEVQNHSSLRLDPNSLFIKEKKSISWCFPRVRRAELYALFVHGWAEREINRLGASQAPSVYQVISFCQQLAFEMFLHSKVSVLISEAPDISKTARLPPDERKALLIRSKEADSWAVKMFHEHEDEQICSPLRRSGNRFSFLHKSLQEYFAACHLGCDIVQHFVEDDWDAICTNETTISTLAICKRCVTNDYGVLRFAAELIDQRVAGFPLPKPDHFQFFGRGLFELLSSNRNSVACANAVTILNAAGVPFTNRDFSGLKLYSEPALTGNEQKNEQAGPCADLSGAILNGCNFRNADLRNVRLSDACLDAVDLRGADLRSPFDTFGQRSMISHSRSKSTIAFAHDGVIFSGAGMAVLPPLSNHNSREKLMLPSDVVCLVLSSDKESLFYAYNDYPRVLQWSLSSASVVQQFSDESYLSAVLSWHRQPGFEKPFFDQVAVALSPDDSTLFVAFPRLIYSDDGFKSLPFDHLITEFSVPDGRLIRRILPPMGYPVRIFSLKFDPLDKSQLFVSLQTALRACPFLLVSVSTSVDQFSTLIHADLSSAAFALCDLMVFVCIPDFIEQSSADTGNVIVRFPSYGSIASLALSHDGKFLFAGGDESSTHGVAARQYSVDTGLLMRFFYGHTRAIQHLLLSSDDKVLFTHSDDGRIRQWGIDTVPPVKSFEGHLGAIQDLVMSNVNSSIFSSDFSSIREWSAETGELLHSLSCGTRTCITMSPDGQEVFYHTIIDGKHYINEWMVQTGTVSKSHLIAFESLNSILYDPAGPSLLIFPDQRSIFRLWLHTSVTTPVFSDFDNYASHGKQLSCLPALCSDRAFACFLALVCFQPDKSPIFAVQSFLLDGSGKTLSRFPYHAQGSAFDIQIVSLLTAPDSKSFFASNANATIFQWDIVSTVLLRTIEPPNANARLSLLKGVSNDSCLLMSSISSAKWFRVSLKTGGVVDIPDDFALTIKGNFFVAADGGVTAHAIVSGKQIWQALPPCLSASMCLFDESTKASETSRLVLRQLAEFPAAIASVDVRLPFLCFTYALRDSEISRNTSNSTPFLDDLIELYKLPELRLSRCERVLSAGINSLVILGTISGAKKVIKFYRAPLSTEALKFHGAVSKLLLNSQEIDQSVFELMRLAIVPEGWLTYRGLRGLVFSWIDNGPREFTAVDRDSVRSQIDACHKLGFCHLDITTRNILPSLHSPAILMDYDCVCSVGSSPQGPVPPESSFRVRCRQRIAFEDDEHLWRLLPWSFIPGD